MIPIFVFNEHHEAFYGWQAAKSQGLIPHRLDLFHIDAHEDMDGPRRFKTPLYFHDRQGGKNIYLDYYKTFTKNELHISNFIVPAALGGIVKNVYFIFPVWKKLKPSRKRMTVCSVFGEGKILKYDVKVKDGPPDRISKVFPDMTSLTFFRRNLGAIPRKRKVILDIDLDYFACRDSIMNHMVYELEISRGQYEDRDRILNDPTLPFSRLQFGFFEQGDRHGVRISFRKTPEASHLPEKQEIQTEIRSLLETLTAREIRPAVITISRSCHSGYCPKEYSEFIEGELVKGLCEAFRVTVMAPDSMPSKITAGVKLLNPVSTPG